MKRRCWTVSLIALLGGAALAQDWTRYDRDRDGRLDRNEWQRMHWTRQNRGAWQRYDVNRNGLLEPVERRHMLQNWLHWRAPHAAGPWPANAEWGEDGSERQRKAWEQQQKWREKAWERQQKVAEQQQKQWEKAREWEDD